MQKTVNRSDLYGYYQYQLDRDLDFYIANKNLMIKVCEKEILKKGYIRMGHAQTKSLFKKKITRIQNLYKMLTKICESLLKGCLKIGQNSV